MIRRSLRIGTRAGALAALVYAAFKVVQARRPTPALPDPDQAWPPRPAPEPDTAAVPREPELVRPAMLESTSLKRRPAPAPQTPPSEPAPVVDDGLEPPDRMVVVVEEPEYDLTSTAPPIVSPMAPSAFVVEIPPAAEVVMEIDADDDEIVIIDEGDDEIVVVSVDDAELVIVDGGEPTDEIVVVTVDTEADVDTPVAEGAEPAAAETASPPPLPEPAPAIEEPVTKRAARKAPTKKAAAKAVARKAAVQTAGVQKAVKKGAARKAVKKAAVRKAAALTAVTRAPVDKVAATKVAAKKAAARKATAKKAAPPVAWVEAWGGVCPTSHPVKAKLRSAIYHLPGMAAYGRTVPDRCYRDAEAAAADGLRPAAR